VDLPLHADTKEKNKNLKEFKNYDMACELNYISQFFFATIIIEKIFIYYYISALLIMWSFQQAVDHIKITLEELNKTNVSLLVELSLIN
jgi:hypothetical protein